MGRKSRKRRRKRQGHYCWACGRYRPNERFSGHGHARHLCRDCAKLGAEELRYRQALRDLERCVTAGGVIRRKRRKQFEEFLRHEDPRIRSIAEEIFTEDQLARAVSRAYADLDDEMAEAFFCQQDEAATGCEQR
jgi:hypothetical protein